MFQKNKVKRPFITFSKTKGPWQLPHSRLDGWRLKLSKFGKFFSRSQRLSVLQQQPNNKKPIWVKALDEFHRGVSVIKSSNRLEAKRTRIYFWLEFSFSLCARGGRVGAKCPALGVVYKPNPDGDFSWKWRRSFFPVRKPSHSAPSHA